MRMTARQYRVMGREKFLDAMLAELEAKAKRPELTSEERASLQEEVVQAKAELAARREQQAVERKAA